MKSRTKLWLRLTVVLALALPAHAEPVKQLKATDYVNDLAHVLDRNSIAQMDSLCQQIDEKAHAQIAVVTVHNLDGSDVESYAVDLFKQWGVGAKSTNRGVLILYAIDDHRVAPTAEQRPSSESSASAALPSSREAKASARAAGLEARFTACSPAEPPRCR